jgi:hypothetical protein
VLLLCSRIKRLLASFTELIVLLVETLADATSTPNSISQHRLYTLPASRLSDFARILL